jgi:hypothetical protein
MLKSRLVGHSSEPTRQEVDAEVDAAVRTFVAAFAPRAAP